MPILLEPVLPQVAVCVRHLVVEHERASRLELVEDAPQALGVVLAVAAEPESAADEDRPVRPRDVELVQGLCVEARRIEAFSRGPLAREREHVGRDVAAVDVELGTQVGHEQAARAAGCVKCRLTGFDEAAEVVDLRTVEVELRPPTRDETVVPGLRRGAVRHADAPV